MSGNALEGKAPHTFLDDLESFYYAMLYIAMVYTAPDCRKEKLPPRLHDWTRPFPEGAKLGFLLSDACPPVGAWFGTPFQTLLDRIHSIFQKIFKQKFLAEVKGQPLPVVNHHEVYDTMISHIRQAIDDLGVEESKRPVEHATPEPDEHLRTEDMFDSASEAGGNPGRRKHLSVITMAAASRPRRRRAK